jgi:hypothetical protein
VCRSLLCNAFYIPVLQNILQFSKFSLRLSIAITQGNWEMCAKCFPYTQGVYMFSRSHPDIYTNVWMNKFWYSNSKIGWGYRGKFVRNYLLKLWGTVRLEWMRFLYFPFFFLKLFLFLSIICSSICLILYYFVMGLIWFLLGSILIACMCLFILREDCGRLLLGQRLRIDFLQFTNCFVYIISSFGFSLPVWCMAEIVYDVEC